MSALVVHGSRPYAWPCSSPLGLDASTTALILIDMQVDFCGLGGYVHQMGYDVSLTRAPIEPLKRVLAAARQAGVRVIHTREGHRPSLADLPANKKWRSDQIGAGIGSPGPCGRILVRGEPGWDIIPDLKPLPHEDIIDKPGKGSFCATDLDLVLRTCGIKRLILGGITTDVCVHTTMREANDRGYECLLLTDGCGATKFSNHEAAVDMVTMQNGVFGAVAAVDDVVKILDSLPRPEKPARAPGAAGATIASAKPFPFTWKSNEVALLMVDWQSDFVDDGGFGASLGNDVKPLRKALGAAANVLRAARECGVPVIHTLEAHMPDLADCPPTKKRRCPAIGTTIKEGRGLVLVRGEPGNNLCAEVSAVDGEKLVYKPGKGAFYGTDLQSHLETLGVKSLIVTGVTTEVCVQSTMREANDRGYECLLVEDATESYFPSFKKATLEMIVAQGAIVGWTATSSDVITNLKKAA